VVSDLILAFLWRAAQQATDEGPVPRGFYEDKNLVLMFLTADEAGRQHLRFYVLSAQLRKAVIERRFDGDKDYGKHPRWTGKPNSEGVGW
jgi:hypothetical protein